MNFHFTIPRVVPSRYRPWIAFLTSATRRRACGRDAVWANAISFPACAECNKSKNAKLLIHWDSERVAHGAAQSFLVAAELERERSGFQADRGHRETRLATPS